jgi:transcriptional regulator with XRE-family HTH domain
MLPQSRRLQLARLRAGFATRADFAKHLGYCNATVERWELGSSRPSVEALMKISDATGESIRDLAAHSDAEEPNVPAP